MQLLKMELRGFKSFADKTTLAFDKGITAIVGPNGSGKSNISDAVRWVMGEQNVRQLRGQKSEDIIFAGTEKRRPQGAAEVSLYFDNTDHSLDLDFTEVVVTRRYFRSGESEFYINKRPCRLKDIHMLFADTGIGQDSMAVIGQNRVDRILNSKPEERRIIFEEVAGISRFKARKQEGLRKIEETNHNLERIRDMMSVLEEQIGPMEEEAHRLKTFRELDGERISYEGTLTLQELRNAERLLTKAENSRAAATTQRQDTMAALAKVEKEHEHLMIIMEQEGTTLRQLDEAASLAHNELDSMKNRKEAGVLRKNELEEEEKQFILEEAQLQEKSTQMDHQRQELAVQLSSRQTELDAARNGFALTAELFKQAEEKANTANQDLQDISVQNAQRQQNLFIVKRDIEELQRRISENQIQCNELKKTTDDQRIHNVTKQECCKVLEEKCLIAKKTVEELTAKAQEMRSKREEACKAQEAAEQEYRTVQNQAASLEQRIRVLEGMEQEHEGAGRTVKEVLNAQQSWRKDICGIVGELCTIPPLYAAALDVALGASARYVVADSEKSAKSAIAYLKERHAGRTTFLPLDTIRAKGRTREEEQAVKEQGIIGFANDLLEFDTVYMPVFTSLLGRTLIADTIDNGTVVAHKYGHRLRIVCLDGTQFNVGGSLTGGSMRNREGSLISRRGLLEELRQQEKINKKKSVLSQQTQNKLLNVRNTIVQQSEDAEVRYQQATLDWQKLFWQAGSAKKEAEQAVSVLAQTEKKLSMLHDAGRILQDTLTRKMLEQEQWTDKPQQNTEKMESACITAQEEMESCRAAMTERQVALATLQEQVKHAQEQLEQNTTWKTQLQADMKRLKTRRDMLNIRRQELTSMLEQITENIFLKEEETKKRNADKEAFYQLKAENFKQSQKWDEMMKKLRNEVENWNQRVNTAEIQLEKYHGEIRHGEERLALQGLSRQEAMERRREGSLKDLTDKVTCLKEQIAMLGQINPNADEEYGRAVEKKQFFTKQCDDLLEAKQKLQAVVSEIDNAMAKQFGQAFKEIGEHFQRIFTRLFGGGSAKLLLTDAHDILNAGVDILIQPPGKKQQQLTLLSGGERALTVIALLFAFLAYHPAPFCLVDEVDAALDEANVERLARYIKNYSGHTQFIVITHRRKTMEAANTLQGVTMEEKGISRLLTVKVDELLKEGVY